LIAFRCLHMDRGIELPGAQHPRCGVTRQALVCVSYLRVQGVQLFRHGEIWIMGKSFSVFAIATALALMASGPASAARLESVEGDVKVHRGNGFERAAAGQELKPGDRVMVGSHGEASIAYDECVERVPVGRVIVVSNAAACRAGAHAVNGAQAVSGGGPGALSVAVVGGLGLAAVGAGIYSVKRNSKQSTSP
jgi:hypothetical protein